MKDPATRKGLETKEKLKVKREYKFDNDVLPAGLAIPMDTPLSAANGVEVRNVTKRFRISQESMGRMSSFLFHRLISNVQRNDFYAVKNVSFDIKRGEMLGVLGVNGSGKSTLLKMITGITAPTTGEIRRLPRIAPLLDLSAGFHPALSGYENIFLNGSIIGLHREEVRELLPEIIDFSGLEHKFLEAPVRTYSAGMMARLGFALAVAVDPDIVLIDEVLAVGDLEFQAKSAQKLLDFRDQGKAMVLVSHTSAAISELSTEAIWLHQGVMEMAGDAQEVVSAYNAHLTEKVRRMGRRENMVELETKISVRPHVVHFDHAQLLNDKNKQATTYETNGSLTLTMLIRAEETTKPVDLLVVFQFQTGIVVEEFFASDRGFTPVELGTEACEVTMVFEPLLLLGGEYAIEVSAFEAGDPESVLGISTELLFNVQSQYSNFDVYPAFLPVHFGLG